MCQEGAIGLARRGCTWRQILSAYYPNAEVKEVGYVSASKTFADPAY
jgi:peptidoglycan hydrolase-like amidase